MLARAERRHRGDHGQVLIAALLILALFGVLAAAVLSYIDGALIAHTRADVTAATDAQARGAASFAVNTVDNQLAQQGSGSCDAPASGAWPTYPAPATPGQKSMSYAVIDCIPNYNNANNGQNCVLCVLSTSSSALTLGNNANLDVTGEVDINGSTSLANNATICSTSLPNCKGNPEFIGLAGTLPSSTSGFTPSPTPLSSTVSDPLAGLAEPALGVVAQPQVTGTAVLTPGPYNGISLSGNSSTVVTLTAGTYVFTGNVTLTGSAKLDGTAGVTLFFTCSTTGAKKQLVSQACSGTGQAGATLDLSGGGQFQFAEPAANSGVVVFDDPHNTSVVSLTGNGTTDALTGTVYAPSAEVDLAGNGQSLFQADGRLIANTVSVKVGAGVAGLTINGPGAKSDGCDLYIASVAGTDFVQGTLTTRKGEVAFASTKCSGGGGIVNFAYTP